jgi:hypothetical protein
VEAGILEMIERMQTVRLKVFCHLLVWFEEFRTYYRKNGALVKQQDDLLSATRYALMMKRYARVEGERESRNRVRMTEGVDYELFGGGDSGSAPQRTQLACGN